MNIELYKFMQAFDDPKVSNEEWQVKLEDAVNAWNQEHDGNLNEEDVFQQYVIEKHKREN